MPHDYRDIYDYSYGPSDYSEPDPSPRGFYYFALILMFYVVSPLTVILNLILFVKTVRTKKINGEPWRWLIAHTSFCMVISAT